MMNKVSKAIHEKQQKYLYSSLILYYDDPIALEKGEGLYVWDADGNKYLDFFAGILTTSVGHNHPKIVKRVQEQVAKMIHTSTMYPHKNHADLGEKLAKITPGDLQTSFFTNSGSEADEMAVLTARQHTGNYDFFALRHGYSGNSSVAKALTAQSSWRFASNIVSGIGYTHNAYCYRCPFKLKPETCGAACAQDFEEVIKTTTPGRIAGIICEPIQGVGGFITPPPEFFPIIRDIAHHYGGVFVSDEVQCGFGRTGKHWFGIEHWDVQPDIMTMAKGIANGFAMGATITSKKISDSMKNQGLLLSTFGGNPVSTVAALATIEALEEEASPDQVEKVGQQLRKGLDKLFEKYSVIGEVRGKGLMQGVELVKDRKTKEPYPEGVSQLFQATKKRGLLIGKGGMYGNVLRISPPLTASEEQVSQALETLDQSFAEVQKAL